MNKPMSVIAGMMVSLLLGTTLFAQTPEEKNTSGAKKPRSTESTFDVAPQISRQIPPVYPKESAAKGVEGTVYVSALISTSGKPSKVKVLKSDAPELNASAVDAVKKWVFTPATAKGKAVAATITIPVKYKLKDDSSK